MCRQALRHELNERWRGCCCCCGGGARGWGGRRAAARVDPQRTVEAAPPIRTVTPSTEALATPLQGSATTGARHCRRLAVYLAVLCSPTALTLAHRLGESTIHTSVARDTLARPGDAGSTTRARVWAEGEVASHAAPPRVAHTDAVSARPMSGAVEGAETVRAVVPAVATLAQARALKAAPVARAVVGAQDGRAVIAGEAFGADALACHAGPTAVTLIQARPELASRPTPSLRAVADAVRVQPVVGALEGRRLATCRCILRLH